jgi:hypothetical protein
MNVHEQIKDYIASQPEPKRGEMQALHDMILQVSPASKLWFLDGKNTEGKIVSNPNIGYGSFTMKYTDGSTREFYRVPSVSRRSREKSAYSQRIFPINRYLW